MSEHEITNIERTLRTFTSRHLEKPDNCRNVEQIRYYVRELRIKIEEYEARFNYVPAWAYALLSQYNQVHNSMLHKDYHRQYA